MKRPVRVLLVCLLFGGGTGLALWWTAVRSATQERLDLELIEAVHRDDAAGAAAAIDRGANVNCGYHPDGRPSVWYRFRHPFSGAADGHATPLSEALTPSSPNWVTNRVYHPRMLRLLLERGADPETRFADWPLIYHATAYGKAEAVRALLEHRCRADLATPNGDTPLKSAVARGDARTAALLLDHGANPNQRYRDGHTLLQEAQDKRPAITEVLRTHGASR